LQAGLLHALEKAGDEGHLFLPQSELLRAAAELLTVEEGALVEPLAAIAAEERVVLEPLAVLTVGAADASAGEVAVYLRHHWLAERSAAVRLKRLQVFPLPPVAIDLERACAWFEQRFAVTLAPAQREAIHRAVLGKVLLLTGGPG